MTAYAAANLSSVRSISAAWERGDYSSVDWAHPEIEFVIADGPEPGSWTGLAGLAPSLLDFQSAWEEYHSEAEEFRELEDGRVLVLTNARGRGRASGAEMAERRANLFHLRDGKVTRLAVYWDRRRALSDAGLAVA
jgi:ketosteroid isomerase-like protein